MLTGEQRRCLRSLEGHNVHLSLADGSRIDDVTLISARSTTVWIFRDGEDAFIPVSEVVDVWETSSRWSAA